MSVDIRSIGAETNKLENGVWEIVVPNIADGAYRYNFVVDGVTVYDPKYPRIADIKPVASISRNQESVLGAKGCSTRSFVPDLLQINNNGNNSSYAYMDTSRL